MTASHILNKVPNKNKEQTPYEIWIGRKQSLTCAHINIPINKKRKLGPKIVDCVFLGYAQRSIAYRFFVVKSELPYMHVDSIMKSRDATVLRIYFL